MKRLIRYKCMIENYLADAKRCKIEQSVITDPDAIKGVQWLMNNREV